MAMFSEQSNDIIFKDNLTPLTVPGERPQVTNFACYLHIVLVVEKNTNILRWEISGSRGYVERIF